MSAMRKVFQCVLVCLLAAILILPIYLIYDMSQKEMEQYAAPPSVNLTLGAYGEIVQVNSMDVPEYVEVSGRVVSDGYYFQDLKVKDPYKIRWLVEIGEIVVKDSVLGFYKDEPITAEATGYIRHISTDSNNAYLRYDTLDSLQIACNMAPIVLEQLQNAETLTTENGNAVSLKPVNGTQNENGTVSVRFSVADMPLSYGQKLDDFKIYTGRVFSNALVLPFRCIYQKESGQDQPWYVHQVDESGMFVEELEVNPGYRFGDQVCVSGVKTGQFVDSGYKAVLGGGNP